MKKLLFAAACAAMVVGVEAACKEGKSTPGACTYPAAVYEWKFKGKTSTAVIHKGIGSVNNCAENPGADEVLRVPGSLAIVCWTYICDDECFNFQNNLQSQPNQFYTTKPYRSAVYNNKAIFVLNAAHIVGNDANQYEMEGDVTFPVTDANDPTMTYQLCFAGFGAYNKKAGQVTSVSGNFAGTQTYPKYPAIIKLDKNTLACPPADYWKCTTCSETKPAKYACDPTAPSVAYGAWSIKLSSAFSAKLAENANWRVK